jgi:hypothetical protein
MRTTLAAAAAAVCLTVGMAPAAHAGRLVHEDARRDVVKMTFSNAGRAESIAPRRADPDVRRISIDYRRGVLIIRTKYAALERRVGRMEFAMLHTRDGHYLAQVQVMRRDHWQGFKVFTSGESEDAESCTTAKHRFDYDTDVSIWTIPASCVGRAPWVRVAQSSAQIAGQTVFHDRAFTKGTVQRPVFSARVWRG